MRSYKSVTVGVGLPTSPVKTFPFSPITNQVLTKETIAAISNGLAKRSPPPSPFSPLPPAREEGENEDLSSDVDVLLDSVDEYGCCHEDGGLQARKKKGRKAALPPRPSNGRRPGQGMTSAVMVNAAQQHEQAQKQRAAKLKRRTSSRTMENLRRAKNAAQQARVASPGLISPCAAGIAAFRPVSPVPSTTPAPICAAAAVPSIRVLQYYFVNAIHLSDAVANACHQAQQALPTSPQIPVTSNKFEVLREAGLESEEELKAVLISTVVDLATEHLFSPVSSPAKEQEQEQSLWDSDSDSDGQLEPVEVFACTFEDSAAFKGTKAIKCQPVVRRTNACGVLRAKAALAAGRRQLTAAKRVADKANYQNVRALRLSKQGLQQTGLGSPIVGGLRPWSGLQSPSKVPVVGRSPAAAPFIAAAVPAFGIAESFAPALILEATDSEVIASVYGIPFSENSFAILGELMPPTPCAGASEDAPAAGKRRREGLLMRGLRLVGGVLVRVASGAVAVVKTAGRAVKRVLSRRS